MDFTTFNRKKMKVEAAGGQHIFALHAKYSQFDSGWRDKSSVRGFTSQFNPSDGPKLR